MNVTQTKHTLMYAPPRQSILVEGDHGKGKSEVVAQVAAELSIKEGVPYELVDIRLGQYEVGDLIGLPEKYATYTVTHSLFEKGKVVNKEIVAENVTVHNLPLWFPRDPDSHGILFFDEINRGTRDTQQWAFQVVLDYKANMVCIPMGWRVVAACNANLDTYNVLGFDPALYDRFLIVKFAPTVKEWQQHAEKTNVHNAILKYISKFPRDLDPPENNIEMGKRYPSRRSWCKFSNTLHYMAERNSDPLQDLDYLILLAGGYVGETVAVNFVEFIKKDYTVYTGEQILNEFPKLKDAFKEMIPTDLTYYSTEICDHIKKSRTDLTKKQSENLFSFIQTVPQEIAAGFWVNFRKECADQSIKWYKTSTEYQAFIRNTLAEPDK